MLIKNYKKLILIILILRQNQTRSHITMFYIKKKKLREQPYSLEKTSTKRRHFIKYLLQFLIGILYTKVDI